MGTRHLVVAIAEGKVKVAQYGQFDGYPSGCGVHVLDFFRSLKFKGRMASFRSNLLKQTFLSAKEISDMQEDILNRLAPPNPSRKEGWINLEESEILKKALPSLHRDVSWQVLPMIAEGQVLPLFNDFTFGHAGLFCEWAYVVDTDQNTLSVYAGFSKTQPKTGLWKGQKKLKDGYASVHLLKTYHLNELPTRRAFVRELNKLTK